MRRRFRWLQATRSLSRSLARRKRQPSAAFSAPAGSRNYSPLWRPSWRPRQPTPSTRIHSGPGPTRRGSDTLLITILIQASLFTLQEALIGFLLGATLGFALGVVFAHSGWLERGLLPYVVASQTVPLLAIAPMVVIWFGGNWFSVALIAAYLTFFPVTINTLRGLRSPEPTAVELMHSYAASSWDILWKLRVPAALPYIFTALKVSATASVVGAIIGELPSGIADGLGRVILNFNQYYATGPEKLWASILFAALTGMVFFLLVTGLERLFVRQGAAET